MSSNIFSDLNKIKDILCLLIICGINLSCDQCAETLYVNNEFNPSECEIVNPYKSGEIYSFVSKSDTSFNYQLEIVERHTLDWELEVEISDFTHLGLACENYNSHEVYTTRYDRTVINTNFIKSVFRRDKLGILIGRRYESGNLFFNINNDYGPIPDKLYPGYQNLSSTEIEKDEESFRLGYKRIDSLLIHNDMIYDLYKIDSMYIAYWNESEWQKDIYFLGALYSFEKGFVRFITKENDTLDLID